jgi:AcrR family transcriptional regulator
MPEDPRVQAPAAVGVELPMVDGWRPQREAAARNEAKIIDAARTLLQSRDAGSLEMRDVARAAGVGIGTLYRRFGDKSRLLAAVIGDQERELQEAVVSGPPPLGPAAPAAERLTAFLAALTHLTERNLNVLLATDSTPPGRLDIAAYKGWRLHIEQLLAELRADLAAEDVGWYADLLLAPLDPELYAHQRRRRGLTSEQIAANLRTLALGLWS